jgi:hypothetical protein
MEYYRLTIPIPKQPWRWLRFRITSLFLLITIACILLAWHRDHQRLSAELNSLKNPSPNWETAQATGPPDCRSFGDQRTAWASLTADDQDEWLILEYDKSIVPEAIVVHENCAPGAIVRATHYPMLGRERTLWEGTDPTPTGSAGGISRLPVEKAIKTRRIKLYIDSTAVNGWNEIDAVGLVDANGAVIWATDANASSSYADRNTNAAQRGNFVYTF